MKNHEIIHTKRLLLRPFAFTDVDDVLAYASDPEWSRFLPVPVPYTIKDAEEFVARNILRYLTTDLGFAIELGGSRHRRDWPAARSADRRWIVALQPFPRPLEPRIDYRSGASSDRLGLHRIRTREGLLLGRRRKRRLLAGNGKDRHDARGHFPKSRLKPRSSPRLSLLRHSPRRMGTPLAMMYSKFATRLCNQTKRTNN